MAFGDVERLRLLDTAKDKPLRLGEISLGVDSIIVFVLLQSLRLRRLIMSCIQADY